MLPLRFLSRVTAEGRFIRQAGGMHRFGRVVLTIEPSEAPGTTYAWEVPEAQIPSMYSKATLDGIKRWFSHGSALDGYELQYTKVRVVDGSHHETDSNELSYTFAAAEAFALAVNAAQLLDRPLAFNKAE
jgi:elongation factor G